MATVSDRTPPGASDNEIPPLEAGDRLTRAEFERRYKAMPGLKKAELIEGVVYMPSPVRLNRHGRPHARLITWLGIYEFNTEGVIVADNATTRLDMDNEPQPDAVLFIDPANGGQARISVDDYIEKAPELVAEVASSSASYDLNDKLTAYRRNGVLRVHCLASAGPSSRLVCAQAGKVSAFASRPIRCISKQDLSRALARPGRLGSRRQEDLASDPPARPCQPRARGVRRAVEPRAKAMSQKQTPCLAQ